MTLTTPMNADKPVSFSAEEIDEIEGVYRPGSSRAVPEWANPESYPRMTNLSGGHIYGDVMVRAERPEPAEYVTLPIRGSDVQLQVNVAEWNIAWEMAQFRRRRYDLEQLPPAMAKVADLGDHNVVFVPRTPSRYFEYAPLFHLLPRSTVERFGLPLIQAGQWPHLIASWPAQFLPSEFHARLQQAWASHVWRHLSAGSPARSFGKDEPIRLLAHNLDYWLPHVTEVIQEILETFPVVGGTPIPADPVRLEDGTILRRAVRSATRVGSELWAGESDSSELTRRAVEHADASGRLRDILEAVRTNRVADDFSNHWSFAREDFERKLHRKRLKISVRFVELTDTIPVQGPEAEVVGRTVTADFMALLNPQDRQVVVLLNSGHTKLTEIADVLGYANHSAISKRLARVRRQAAEFFDLR